MTLTRRELEIVQAIAKGHTGDKQIGHELCISPRTVENHIHSIYKKTGVQDRTNLLLWAIRTGVVVVGVEVVA